MKTRYKISKRHPNKIAFITGAGSGLGLSLSLKLAADGWTIGMADINAERLNEAENRVFEVGGTPYAYCLDVTDKVRYKQVADEFLAQTNSIDLLINNAGVADGDQFEDISLDTWDWIVGINQMGVIYGCHFFISSMKANKQGTIVNLSSSAAFATYPGMSAYNTPKTAVLGFSETLNAEFKPHNIHVSVVMPMFFRTNLAESCHGKQNSVDAAKHMVETAPHTPDEVAEDILINVGNKKFQIYGMKRAWALHWVARLLPGPFRWFKILASKNRELVQEKAREKYLRHLSKQGAK